MRTPFVQAWIIFAILAEIIDEKKIKCKNKKKSIQIITIIMSSVLA